LDCWSTLAPQEMPQITSRYAALFFGAGNF
jgi:hypothetical protein